jgi:hypothetical protein
MDDVLNIQKLLSEAGSIVQKHDLFVRETGGNFNIFEIADISTKEMVVCRVLAELLSPAGHHGQSGDYLEKFLHGCLDVKINRTDINKASVYCEYAANGRRIDIVIEVGNRFIPIEVKIYAGEGDAQCHDYFYFARNVKQDKNAKVVYLTRFGDMPSEYSAKGLSENDIVNLSFSENILKWLRECLTLPDTITKAPIREIILQFISAIKHFTNQQEDKPMDEIRKLLFSSPENLHNAMNIIGALDSCKAERADMIMKFFAAIDEKFANVRVTRAPSAGKDYTTNYAPVKSGKHPGINYTVKTVVNEIDLLFRIEIGYYGDFFAGFILAKNNELISDKTLINSNAVKEMFLSFDESEDGWWINWDYLKFNDDTINFKEFNENYFKLFDPASFDNIVDGVVEQANKLLDVLA